MWGDGFVNYRDCEDHFPTYTHIKTSGYTPSIYTISICQLHPNKAGNKI